MNNWKPISIGQFIDFNPTEKILKGKSVKKIPMAMLTEYERKIKGFEYANYNGGPKFKNGDTLVAKITPCLENGKTAQVDILEENEIAFGSSEFIVLRENENSLNDYIFYLARSPVFRERAISCMEGTSGRKRVNETALKRQEILAPDRVTQKKIAKVLSSLDYKIEVNCRINADLETIAKTLYDYWFVQFDFPDAAGKPYKSSGGKMVYNEILKREIPDKWEVKSLFDAADVQYGFPFSTNYFNENNGYPVIRIRDIKDNSISLFSTQENIDNRYLIKPGDLLIGMDGNFHINYWSNDNCYLNQRVVRIRKKELSNIYIRYQIEPVIQLRERSVSRTTVGHLSDKDLKAINILLPSVSIRNNLNDTFDTLLAKIISNQKQNRQISSMRDWLLPMLMNGQVKVSTTVDEMNKTITKKETAIIT